MKKLVTHLVSLLIGCALTSFLLFNFNSESETNVVSNSTHTSLNETQISTGFNSADVSEEADKKNQLIAQQAEELARLKQELQLVQDELAASLTSAQKQAPLASKEDVESEAKLRTMNMQTFEESMKTQFTDQFKGIVLQLEGQRLEDIKSSYTSSTAKNEWSNQYENSIANYLAANDENGDHYLQSLNCNTNVCRLEVNTNDSDNWNRLYARMTNEPWYQSITVQEKSDYPGNVIYYLPSLNN